MLCAQFFKTKDVISKRIVKILISKYGIYVIFAEKMRVAFAFAKAFLIFQQNTCE